MSRHLDPTRTPLVITVGSGKGGVGKSIIASNVAVELSRRGLRTVIADLDVGGANVHVLFGQFDPRATLGDFIARRVKTIDQAAVELSSFYGLRVLAGAGETLTSANLPYASKKRLMHHVRAMDADVVLVDVGPGTSYHSLDFFLMGDVNIAVTTPDPTSIVDVYRFVKLAALRTVVSAFVRRDPVYARLSGEEFGSLDDVIRAVDAEDAQSVDVAHRALASFAPCLVLNRVAGDRDHPAATTLRLRNLLRDYVGAEITMLGAIPEDAAIERSVQSFLPVVVGTPRAASAAALRALVDTLQARVRTPATAPGGSWVRDADSRERRTTRTISSPI